jgi:hypothetical protein
LRRQRLVLPPIETIGHLYRLVCKPVPVHAGIFGMQRCVNQALIGAVCGTVAR